MGRQSKEEQQNQKITARKKVKANHKKPWSEKQDKLLIKLIEKHGPSRWSAIARGITGRQGKQCRERWHNHLNPEIKKSEWETMQEWTLFLAHEVHQSRWALMTRLILGRTDNAIKNHWNSGMKKRLKEFADVLQNLIKDGKTSYLDSFCENQHYLDIERQLMSKVLQNQNSIKEQSSPTQKQNENAKNVPVVHTDLFKPQDSQILAPSNKPFLQQNASNIKEIQTQDPKIMRLNSILSEKKQRFTYSMMFETPPRNTFPPEGFEDRIQQSKPQLVVEEIDLEGSSNNVGMDSPSKFIMI